MFRGSNSHLLHGLCVDDGDGTHAAAEPCNIDFVRDTPPHIAVCFFNL